MSRSVRDARVQIRHEPSEYHAFGRHYRTRIRNAGDTPFRVRRFAAFRRDGGQYRLSTITNSWFTEDQFRNWFHWKTEWIAPGSEVSDPDNYGFGMGCRVFEIKFQTGEVLLVRERLPRTKITAGGGENRWTRIFNHTGIRKLCKWFSGTASR